jgi:hypothetical protein
MQLPPVIPPPRHVPARGGRLLLINVNLSRHGRRKTHAHARLLLRHNNGKLSKSVKQQSMSELSELVWLNKVE